MLCKLGQESEVKCAPSMIWEEKFDGIRAIVTLGPGTKDIQARSGSNKTHLFPELKMESHVPCVLDGEIISTNFNAIQHRTNRVEGIEGASKEYPAIFMAFDILSVKGQDVRRLPLLDRKNLLTAAVVANGTLKVAAYTTDGVGLWKLANESNREGIVGKPVNSPYIEGNREVWRKIKCWKLGTFLVVGYTAGTGWRKDTFGSLVLAEVTPAGLVFAGETNVSKPAEIDAIYAALVKTPGPCPWPKSPPLGEPAVWSSCGLMVNVQYLERTKENVLRFPSFKGIADV